MSNNNGGGNWWLGYLLATVFQLGLLFLALGFTVWAGKMFLRALSY